MKLHAEIQGNNKNSVIIILHGLFGSVSNWRNIAKTLAKTHKVISLDLRNHGNSPWSQEMNYTVMAEDVEKYIVDNQVDNPIIMGHSMGGKVAMTLAQRNPEKYPITFVIDIAPVHYSHNFSQIISMMQEIDFNKISSRQQAIDIMRKKSGDIALVQFLSQNIKTEHHGYQWRINLQSISKNIDKIVNFHYNEAVAAKIIFIAGEESDYVQASHHPIIKRTFPKAEIQYIEKAGHWLHATHPQKLIKLIFQYLP